MAKYRRLLTAHLLFEAMEALRSIAASLLNSQQPAHALRPEVLELARLFAAAQKRWPRPTDDIACGETRTTHGLALSPTMAALCLDDYVRTIQFLRGTHAAIVALRKQFPNRPIRVLYVGCGPWATLAVPLMAVFSPTEAVFTLLDLHAESIESAKAVVHALGLSSAVAGFETQDAIAYCGAAALPPDILLVEVMQACLASEPQVAITRHLLKLFPRAILIPEEVRIDLTLINPVNEFKLSPPERPAPSQRDRIPVGPVFVLNRETVKSWESESGSGLPGARVRIPAPLVSGYQPMLFTAVRVYGNYTLGDYDSGLTSPRQPEITGEIKSGDTVQFHYELGSHPRLRGEVSSSTVSATSPT